MIHIDETNKGSRTVMIGFNAAKELYAEVHTFGVAINSQFDGDKEIIAIIGGAFVDGLVEGEKSKLIKRKEELAECHMN